MQDIEKTLVCLIILLCFSRSVVSFQSASRLKQSHFSLISRNSIRLRAEAEGSQSSSSANSEFVANSPIKLGNDEEVEVDFNALSAESAFQAFQPKTDISSMYVKGERKAPRQAQWFPMLLSPVALDGTFAGDVGFDPLNFSKDKAAAYRMREAEIKHARLAMLAAAGWPLSELWHKEVADILHLDSILASAGRAPSVLNGGLANFWIIGAGAAALAVGALLEFRTMAQQKKKDYKPGELGFDPLGLHGFRATFGLDPITEKTTREEKIRRAKFDMELSEIKHGRLAMLAITGYAMQELVTGIPVVQQTPFFFGDPLV